MSLLVSPMISRIEAPPIAEAMTWVRPGERNRELLNLCQAVPSYAPADALQNEIARLALDPATSLYTDISGVPELRTALAQHMATDYAGAIDQENVSITSGCNQAFCAAIMALAQRGDNVVLPAPYYFNHQMWLDMLGVEKRLVPAFAEGRAYPLPQDAAALIDNRTQAIVLCSPNNPTGAIYPPHIIEGFYDLARSTGIALIIDETYKDFRSSPEPLHGLFAKQGWEETFIQLYSFFPGLRAYGLSRGLNYCGRQSSGGGRKDIGLHGHLRAADFTTRRFVWTGKSWGLETGKAAPYGSAARGPVGRFRPSPAFLQAHQFRGLFCLCEASVFKRSCENCSQAIGGRARRLVPARLHVRAGARGLPTLRLRKFRG